MTKKILWLSSWYPNEMRPFDGDFIQRHAIAVSEYHDLDVMYVHKYEGDEPVAGYSKTVYPHLTEHIFTNHVADTGFLQTLKGLIQYFLIHTRFIKKHGMPDLIHVQIPMKAGLVALYYKWRYKIPYIVTEHYGFYNPLLENHFRKRSFFYRYATRLVLKHADILTTVSNSLGDDINNWVLKKEYTTIPNVVDTTIFHYTEPVAKEKFRFIHISNMIPLKNVQGIIEATEMLAAERRDFEMVFIGGVSEEFYKLASEKKMLNKVIFFEGVIPYNAVSSRIKASDAMIIFSDTESQSCVVLESLCCGRPAIVTNVGGVKELINESNGYKVKPRDNTDLAEKMNMMIGQYPFFDLKKISEDAISKYAYSEVAKQFSECYGRVLNRQ